jgi:hypothetical protein
MPSLYQSLLTDTQASWVTGLRLSKCSALSGWGTGVPAKYSKTRLLKILNHFLAGREKMLSNCTNCLKSIFSKNSRLAILDLPTGGNGHNISNVPSITEVKQH